MLQLGTYDYPYAKFTKVFVELFNYYDNHPGAEIKVLVNLDQSTTKALWNFK